MSRAKYSELQEKFGRSYVAHFDDGSVIAAPTIDALLVKLEERSISPSDVEIEFVESPDVIGIY